MGQFAEGVELLTKASALDPGDATAHNDLGVALNALKRFADALASLDRAVALRSDYADALANRGAALRGRGKPDQALASLDRAIAIAPGHASAHCNRGNALKDLKRFEEAIASYDAAIALNPRHADAYYNRGDALRELERLDEALADYDKAIALEPEHGDARLRRAAHYLADGDYARGWEEYEWRWTSSECTSPKLATTKPLWSGARSNNRLLIWAEQGVGDQILHCGILRTLKNFPQKKIVSLDGRLLPLFRRSLPEFEFRDKADIVSDESCDEQIPMGSLGRHFRTSVESFADHKLPYLKADEVLSDRLRSRLKESGRIACGLSWSSRNARFGEAKSFALADLLPVLRLPGLTFVDLQYGDTSHEKRELKSAHGVDIATVEDIDNFNDIDGLAALIAACDLVITGSNTTAHLASALGKETLLILPRVRGKIWCWQSAGGASLWYPSIRIFGQSEQGRWDRPVADVRGYLETRR